MASGVATTRLKKLHFMNWLNQNCESSVWVGDFDSGFPQGEIGTAGNSHNLLREFVNSVMNDMFMTLPRKGLPSADRALQISKGIMRQGFGEHICTLMSSANFLCRHFPV